MGSPANKGDSLSSLITVCGLLRIVEGILTWNEVSLCSGGIGITSIDVIENRICTAQTGIEIIHDIPGGDMYRRPGIQIRIIRDSSSCLETISAGIGEFHSIITFRNILEPGSKAICYFIRLILVPSAAISMGFVCFSISGVAVLFKTWTFNSASPTGKGSWTIWIRASILGFLPSAIVPIR